MTEFDHISRFEGVVPHFYLDVNGYVTVGCGNLVPSEDAAKKLFMRDHRTKVQATARQLIDEYRVVASMKSGMKASAYADACHLEMTDIEIRRLFDQRVQEFKMQLRAVYSNYDAIPAPCQLALLDMAFNLGAGALNRKWPKLKLAVSSMNWEEAATQCIRPQSSKARNDATTELFRRGYTA